MKELYGTTLKLTSHYAVGNIIRKGIQFLMVPFVTAAIPTADYGAVGMAALVVAFLALLTETPAITGALERFFFHPDYIHRQGKLLFNLALFAAGKSVIVTAAYLLAIPLMSRLLLKNAQYEGLLAWFSLVLLLWPIWSMLLSLMKLRELAGRYVLFNCISGAACGATTLYLLLFRGWGASAVAVGLAVDYAVVIVLAAPIFLREASFKLDLGMIRRPLAFGYPLLGSGAARLATLLVNRAIIIFYRGLGPAGIFSFGFGLSEAVDSVAVNPFANGIAPTIRKLESDANRQRQFIRHAATSYYLLAMFLGLGLSLLSPELVRLLGRQEGYWRAEVVVPLLAMAFVQQALGTFLEWGMVMRNKSYHISAVLIASCCANIALSLVLVPLWGIAGAAAAMTASYVIWNILKMYYSARMYDLHFELGRLAHITAVGVGLFALCLPVWSRDPSVAIIALKLAVIAAFPLVCYATRLFRRTEVEFARNFVRLIRTSGLQRALREVFAPTQPEEAQR